MASVSVPLFVLLVLVCSVQSTLLSTNNQENLVDIQTQFELFKQTYSKSYASVQEHEWRLRVFADNLRKADKLNKSPGNRAIYGITQFMDLEASEFKKYWQGYVASEQIKPTINDQIQENNYTSDSGSNYPDNFNWVEKGATTPIYNQGQCGGCWAFSVTETVESFWYLSGRALNKLSMQQLISCDKLDNGCHGGSTGTGFEYVKHSGGLETFQDYPYTSYEGQRGECRLNQSEELATIKHWYYVSWDSHPDEQAMMDAVWNKGPLSICVDSDSWQFYRSGVLSSHCYQSLNHCVQLTGWGTESGPTGRKYWIVRNSWGVAWGMSGYIWIEYGKNLCGIADAATAVVI